MKTSIWCEFLSPQNVCQDYLLNILKEYSVTLNYKLEFGCDNDEFYEMLRIYNDREIPIAIWATLPDNLGYWINESNALFFREYIHTFVGRINKLNIKIQGLCIDLESPLQEMKKLMQPGLSFDKAASLAKIFTTNLDRKRFNDATEVFNDVANYLRQHGIISYATSARHCYYDIRFKTDLIQNALDIPFTVVNWDKYNFMYYATIMRQEFEKSKNYNVDYMVYNQVLHLKKKLGQKLAISVGVTNIGKLGNEPFYKNYQEFEKDIGIIKECQVNDICLFSLDGILEEEKVRNYFEIIDRAKPFKPEVNHNVILKEQAIGKLLGIMNLYSKFHY